MISIVQIDTTNICNAKCNFCFRNLDCFNRTLGIMSNETFKNIVDNNPAEVFVLCAFGEPLCDPRIVERVKYVRKKYKNTEINFNTNGGLLTTDLIDDLVKAGLSTLFITCYGLFHDHDNIQEGIIFEKVLNMTLYANVLIKTIIICNDVPGVRMAEVKNFWNRYDINVVDGDTITWGDKQVGELSPHSVCGVMFGKKIFHWNGEQTTCCFDYNGLNTFSSIEELKTKDFTFCDGCKFKKEFDRWRMGE